MQESQVQSLGREDSVEEEMVTHSSILAWKTLWTEEPGRRQSIGSQRVKLDWTYTQDVSYLCWESWKQWLQEQWECLMLRYSRSLSLFPVKELGLLGGVADLGLRHENTGWALNILWSHKVRKWLNRKNKNYENLLIEQELLMAKAWIIWATE